MSVESPCVGICMLDDNEEYCLGCYRSAQEIFSWELFTDEQKLEVIENIAKRRGEQKSS